MKKIECVIRSVQATALIDSLRTVGVGGMTISEVKGFGKETTRPDAYLILPKTKIEIYATDDQLSDILSAIYSVCRTGALGDGKVAVYEIEDVIRVRTEEHAEAAVL